MKIQTTQNMGNSSDVSDSVRKAHGDMQTNEKGMKFSRYFTKEGVDPFDEIVCEKRTSVITEPDGTKVFEMKDIEVPADWSQLATDIIASKYAKRAGVPETGHEVSAKQIVHRIAHSIRNYGEKYGYFASKVDADVFEAELKHMLITQKGAFNSPVWFNCGLFQEYGIEGTAGACYWNQEEEKIMDTNNGYEHPQCSACFIQRVEDDLMNIFDLVKNEAKLFKYGSGTGSNFSRLRGKQEKLSGGGTSSGLMSFLEVLDKGAGATKSGGTTRRAAKMVCLDMDHPEIVDFINWKMKEEDKVRALIAAGYPSDFNGEAYKTVSGQNSNNSVRVPDSFMKAYTEGGKWHTIARTNGEIVGEYDAEDLMNQIAQAAWACADPGVQFDDTINDWHTCPISDKIYSSNPCSEYMFVDDSACNLASLNLMKFRNEDGTFDIGAYRHANRIFFTAQEILVDFSSYPTAPIAQNSHDFRPLGLGYANLGTLLMTSGLAYDSDEGRAMASAITAIMHGEAYRTSSELASVKGTFAQYQKNSKPMMRVMNMHRDKAYEISDKAPKYLLDAAKEIWDDVVVFGQTYGFRNAQATVLAPTGTIGLLMDCDTTGVEPEFALVKFKKLAGGGYFKIINQSIPLALSGLGYMQEQITDIIDYLLGKGTFEGAPHADITELKKFGFSEKEIEEAEQSLAKTKNFNEWTPNINPTTLKEKGLSSKQIKELTDYISGTQTIEGAPHIKDEHLVIFDCANKCGDGERFIEPRGHIHMMAAVQPFLSGAISKTVNIPSETTVEEIQDIYTESWELGLKAVALYRDGCKASQPLNSGSSGSKAKDEEVEIGPMRGTKIDLPAKRTGITVEAAIAGQKVYMRTGEYDDGKLGEVFIDMFKEGASYRSLLNCFAVAISVGLQYGVPLEKFVDAFTFTRFEPSGMTTHPNIKTATSVVDFIFRTLGMEYLGRTDFVHVKPTEVRKQSNEKIADIKKAIDKEQIVSNEVAEVEVTDVQVGEAETKDSMDSHLSHMMGDAPACNICGHITVRNGSCYKCLSCGNSMGCS